MISEMKNSAVFAEISNKAEIKFMKTYGKKSNATDIPFRPMGEIRKNGKKRMQNWQKRSKN